MISSYSWPSIVPHPGQRILHRMHIFRIVEIDERFVVECAARGNWLDDSADLSSWHNSPILLFIAWR